MSESFGLSVWHLHPTFAIRIIINTIPVILLKFNIFFIPEICQCILHSDSIGKTEVILPHVRACLQTIQYISKQKVVQTETRELSSVSRGKVKSSDTDDWKHEQLYVPPLPPTNLRGCHLIRIQYDVFVSSLNTTLVGSRFTNSVYLVLFIFNYILIYFFIY